MFTQTRNLVLASFLAALPTSIAAQTADQPAQTTAPGDQPATTAPADPGAAATDTAPADATPPPAPVEGQITLQSEDSILANDLIGSRVHSTADEAVGEINDLIVNLDGSIEGVVIGVGGFLGIGEKDVAVQMAALSVATDPESGAVRLVLDATRADLEAAPEFKTATQQKAEQDMQQQGTTGAPAAPAAPADGTAGN